LTRSCGSLREPRPGEDPATQEPLSGSGLKEARSFSAVRLNQSRSPPPGLWVAVGNEGGWLGSVFQAL
jgi:hypothetical protein